MSDKKTAWFAKFISIFAGFNKHLAESCKNKIVYVLQKTPKMDVLFSFYSFGKGARRCSGTAEARDPGAFLMAGVTRLELAASGVTGRRSNQLSYTPNMIGV